MDKTAKKQPKDWREARRLRAWELAQKGWQQKDIAEALGVSAGVEALYHRKGGGPKPRLSEEQLAALPALLAQGAEHFGFRGDVWTQPRVAALIKREFGIAYHPRHVGRLLNQMKWSRQKPLERATQRNEAAIEEWRTDTWANIKKKPNGKDVPSCS
jgi:transposase